MSTIFQADPTYATTTAKVVGPCWVEYPFANRGDKITKIYHHPMKQALANYAPLADDTVLTAAGAKPDGSPFPDDSAAYYIGDSPTQPSSGGFVEFDRQFANIPQSRIETNGFYAYTRPGIDFGINFAVYGASWKTGNSTSKSFTNSPEPRITLTIPSSPVRSDIFAVGDSVNVYNPNSWSYDSGEGSTTVFAGVILSKSTNTFTINDLKHPTANPLTTNNVVSIGSDNGAANYQLWLALRERPQRNINVASFYELSYVKTSAPESIILINSGETNDAQLSNNTAPNISDYLDDIYDNYTIQIEPETIDRWQGNIYEKRRIVAKIPIHENFAY